jgi:hypothetical protein
MNVTVLVSLITALAAILAPNISEIIRSRNERRIKILELVYPQKRDAYKHFVGCFGTWRDHPDHKEFWLTVVHSAEPVLLLASPASCSAVQDLLNASPADRERLFRIAQSLLNQELQP